MLFHDVTESFLIDAIRIFAHPTSDVQVKFGGIQNSYINTVGTDNSYFVGVYCPITVKDRIVAHNALVMGERTE
jgi:hypothetical protein